MSEYYKSVFLLVFDPCSLYNNVITFFPPPTTQVLLSWLFAAVIVSTFLPPCRP